MSSMLKRILIAIGILAVVGIILWLNGWFFAVGILLISLMAEYEMVRAVSKKGAPAPLTLNLCAVAGLFAAFYFLSFKGAFLTAVIYLTICFALAVFSKKYTVESVIKGVFSFVYPGLLFMFFYALTLKGNAEGLIDENTNRLVVLLTVVIPIMTDTMAYFIGSKFGRHKLCPQISPKKSVEGAIGGVLGGILGAVAMYFILGADLSLWAYIAFAAVVSVLSQMGDLSASLVKRKFEIKDYSRVLGEHGGIMDRLDSILFIMPYSYVFFFMLCGFN